MTYVAGGRQFVDIAAGGHARAGTTFGASVVAFALPPPMPEADAARRPRG
jgi:glucose dehydrogenase